MIPHIRSSSRMQFAALSSIDIYCHRVQKCWYPKRFLGVLGLEQQPQCPID